MNSTHAAPSRSAFAACIHHPQGTANNEITSAVMESAVSVPHMAQRNTRPSPWSSNEMQHQRYHSSIIPASEFNDRHLESTSSEESTCWPPTMLYDVMEFLRTDSDTHVSLTQNHAPSHLPYEIIQYIAHFIQNAGQHQNWRTLCKSHFFALQENWEQKRAAACLRDYTWLISSISDNWELAEDLVQELVNSIHPTDGIYNQLLATPLSEEVQTLLTLYALSSSFYSNNNRSKEAERQKHDLEINAVATSTLKTIPDEKIIAIFSKVSKWQRSSTNSEISKYSKENNSLKNIFLRSFPLSLRISESSLPLVNSFMNIILENHYILRFEIDEYLELFLDSVSCHSKLQQLKTEKLNFSTHPDRLNITELLFNLSVIKISNFDSRIATVSSDLQPILSKLQNCFTKLTQSDKNSLLAQLTKSAKINEDLFESHFNPIGHLNDFQLRTSSGWPAGWGILLALTNTLQDETSRLSILTDLADMLENKIQLMSKTYTKIVQDIKTLERGFPRSLQLLSAIVGFPPTSTDLIAKKLTLLNNKPLISIHEEWKILSTPSHKKKSNTDPELHCVLMHLQLTEQSDWSKFPSRFDFRLITTMKGLRHLQAEAQNLSSSEPAQAFRTRLNSIAKLNPFYTQN